MKPLNEKVLELWLEKLPTGEVLLKSQYPNGFAYSEYIINTKGKSTKVNFGNLEELKVNFGNLEKLGGGEK